MKLKEGSKLLVVSLYVDDLIWKLCDYVWWFQNLYCKPLLAQGLDKFIYKHLQENKIK